MCRSFLSVWKDESGKEILDGRNNLGVVSVNIPRIAIEAEGCIGKFWELLDIRCELAHKALQERMAVLKDLTAEASPALYQQGVFGKRLNPTDKPWDELFKDNRASVSLGYLGIHETVCMLLGIEKVLHNKEAESLGIEICKFLKSKADMWKKAENIGYSLYSTPSEGLCDRFLRLDRIKYGIIPATIETKTYDVEDNKTDIPKTFNVSIGNDPTKVSFMSVVPDPNGGPFNCLPFDPLLGIPHQGRLVTGILNPTGFAKDSIENEIQINKMKAQVEAKYIRTSASYVEMIAKKYSSIDSQAQILAATLTNNSIILEQKAKDLELGLAKIQEQKNKELENIELKFGNFMKEPIFGTVSSGYEKNRIDYEKKLIEADIKAKLDMTGKTTAKDIAGPGNGLIGV
jgi:hypothetical protein